MSYSGEVWNGRNLVSPGRLVCDMVENCPDLVTHIDTAGFAYCTEHGLERRAYEPCRKLRPWELRRLLRGVPLNHY